mmetsp:Transcript_3022/g.4056  ORF Transcript_3022/g.4056 Transcript_3022/m.4056 type:complete len:336 (+) Transcript_3022:3-1010(+)
MSVKEIWAAKKEYDIQQGKDKDKGVQKTTLVDFMFIYLEEVYKSPESITSVAYNLMWGCARYGYDADIDIFLNVLKGEVLEDVFHDQVKLMDDMIFLMRALDERTNGRVLGAITCFELEGLLREFFHSKSESQIQEMLRTAEEDLRAKAPQQWEQKVVAYEMLFEEDENLDQGPFAECVRDQHLRARTMFTDEVNKVLSASAKLGPATLPMAQEALLAVDPNLKPKLMYDYLARGFNITIKELMMKLGSEDDPIKVPVGKFIRNLKAGVIAQKSKVEGKTGKKGKKGSEKGNKKSSFALAVQALNTFKGEEGSDDEDATSPERKGGKKKGGKKKG